MLGICEALIIVATVLSGCGASASSGAPGGSAAAVVSAETTTSAGSSGATPFKFGLAAPFTGEYADYGGSHKMGADLAVAELSERGGVNGGLVSYVLADDLGDSKEAPIVAHRLSESEDVLFVDGHMFSGVTLAAGPVYEDAGLPMITPSATNADIANLGSFIWRICMTDAAQGEGLGNYAVGTLGARKIAIIYSDDDYGRAVADAFVAAAEAAGGEIVARERYASSDTDYKAQLTSIKDADPALILVAGRWAEGSRIASKARELGISAQLLGPDALASDQLAKQGGTAVEGMLISTFFDSSRQDPTVRRFVERYKELSEGQEPDWFAAASYDVIMLAAWAAEKAGENSRSGINAALSGLAEGYRGVTGTFGFDENGDVVRPLNMVIVKDGRLVTAPEQP